VLLARPVGNQSFWDYERRTAVGEANLDYRASSLSEHKIAQEVAV
jgi:hypothetical protein